MSPEETDSAAGGIEEVVAPLVERLGRIEEEIASLKALQKGRLLPPRDLTEFERDVNASLEDAEPFFQDLTALMEKEMEGGNAKGIALLGGLYEDNGTGRRAWWASRQGIESLLANLERDLVRVADLASALSSPSRLEIMGGLCHGPRRFSDLSRITGVKGGQLTHHIHPLTRQGLVKKQHDAYAITNKGWKVLHAILLASLQ